VWNQVAGTVAQQEGSSGLDAARAFALMNMTFHDALLTSFTGKYLYGLWRPVTAIREAARDGNRATDADPTWTSLVPSPPYPGHPGNMACLGAANARVLARVFGRDAVPFSVAWTGTTGPTVTKRYHGFRELADEGGYARIWGGIHFRFETLASFGACTRLGDYAADNVLRAR
jgi:PAP2 superfamily